MDTKDWLFLAGLLVSIVTSAVAVSPQLRRVPAQNKKDQLDSVKIALEMAGMDIKEQLDLKKKVKKLEERLDILTNSRYELIIVFSPGETPKVERASIRLLDHPKEPSIVD